MRPLIRLLAIARIHLLPRAGEGKVLTASSHLWGRQAIGSLAAQSWWGWNAVCLNNPHSVPLESGREVRVRPIVVILFALYKWLWGGEWPLIFLLPLAGEGGRAQ